MPLAIVNSCALLGMQAPKVHVEVDLSPGLPQFNLVGVPDAGVRESRIRVRSAILNSGFQFPNAHITANLSPADIPKESGRFDLAIALGILMASDQVQLAPELLNQGFNNFIFVGELSLSGEIIPVRAPLIIALSVLRQLGKKAVLFLPHDNISQARLLPDLAMVGVNSLKEVVSHLEHIPLPLTTCTHLPQDSEDQEECLSDVRGQIQAVKALEICASGGHGLIMSGPPGVGKTMLAQRLPGLLPELTQQQLLEVIAVHSLHHMGQTKPSRRPPFRAPHHSSSAVALVGGGHPLRPGEISLAHHGVLFMDELPEFHRPVLESLREPLETGEIQLSRARMSATFPARFQLIAAMNPCPCGYLNHPTKICTCRPDQIQRYQSKISGPLLDRIDMHLNLIPPSGNLHDQTVAPTSTEVRARVSACRKFQYDRQGCLNAHLTSKALKEFAPLGKTEQDLLDQAMKQQQWSIRVYQRILKVARTVADLQEQKHIHGEALAIAMTYRMPLS